MDKQGANKFRIPQATQKLVTITSTVKNSPEIYKNGFYKNNHLRSKVAFMEALFYFCKSYPQLLADGVFQDWGEITTLTMTWFRKSRALTGFAKFQNLNSGGLRNMTRSRSWFIKCIWIAWSDSADEENIEYLEKRFSKWPQ